MLIDDVTIEVISGSGGDGRAVFNRTMMSLGPTGGTGGKGGDVYLRGVSNLGALIRFRGQKVFRAGKGQMGGIQKKDGKSGEDLILNVPVGTVVHFPLRGIKEITKIGEQLLIIKGGAGGRGNFTFRSPTNTTPQQFEKGKAGDSMRLQLELKLIADVGLIGLPNVGKSSLLNKLTNAKSRVANYSFTTLEPNLGAYWELILADIPGLIEGASSGKGLGIKFLRHIERTKIFFHLISSQSENPLKDYTIVRKELEKYNKQLLGKKEYVFLSKCDLAKPLEIKRKIAKLKKVNSNVYAISIEKKDSMSSVKKILNKIKEDKTFVKKEK